MTTSEAAAGPSPATSKALQKSADTVAAAVFRGDTGEAAQLTRGPSHNSPPRSLRRLAAGGWPVVVVVVVVSRSPGAILIL